MQVDSMDAIIERCVNRVRLNVPADYAYHCKKARKNPKPYEVTDIRGLRYTPVGDIYYKLRFSDE
ncbi:unnamed protein product [Acanthoscelides obtectus]|uniref:Uncharacterized protein n=1 Tax=Acanthoscelides obtectus TaxID=200917 RepID=A0A9P0LV44_ACAOB|nr:unnamed protein product [Acanthoscelides obtectus]CAK1631038.1 hypothetical protein AOBTE_LOCUS6719 [Acanthoscelides obtectus]